MTEAHRQDASLPGAIRRILTPLARLLIARGVRFQAASDWLKEVYLLAGAEIAEGRRLTDSRLSVLTGLQRKDIKTIRARLDQGESAGATTGPLPRLIQAWRATPAFQAADGGPAVLARSGDGPSFDRLAASVSTDIHPRSLLDELLRLGLIEERADGLRLLAEAFIPGGDRASLDAYLGGNLGDHAEAAVTNVLTDGRPPFFERAAHFNNLSGAALAELDAMARSLQQAVLEKIAARAAELQHRDASDAGARGRFRCGAFILTRPDANEGRDP